ncbi:MAG: 3-deoxy-7-phosphoheptulonate synthase [Gammaproteobacteria bacterium]|jgi:3-deoxy-7-phosphoheptulonate synthase|nr:3-deoxy-7-phosphoheptulonate synthase [Gammaproteobacteria bacterium]|tara:strand:+ start:18553 stop:19602 length:1050 start_codon:yes stop_codon:yes gene_type:complete
MNYSTDNTRIIDRKKVPAPYELVNKYPINDEISKLVYGTRNEISQILHNKDDRLFVIVGPCSIHDPKSAIEYAEMLSNENKKYNENLLVIMRVYFEKPRTTVGWKGLINDPDINETYNIAKGVEMARKLLIDIADLGLPAGTEFLDPISPQYVTDIISWGAIGARTAESQIHRELASGLSCPIGIKNATNGGLKAAIDGIQAANHSHVFLGATKEADIAMLKTAGNNDTHIILRGGKVPNFDKESVEQTLTALKEAEVNESIMIDASHGNSQKKFKQQIPVIESICQQITEGNNNIKGVMIESHLNEGNQKITEKLNYGQSITDACMGWEDTVMCLQKLNDTIKLKRGK